MRNLPPVARFTLPPASEMPPEKVEVALLPEIVVVAVPPMRSEPMLFVEVKVAAPAVSALVPMLIAPKPEPILPEVSVPTVRMEDWPA